MSRVYVGLGSNLGDRVANIAAALRGLDALDHTQVHAVSHVYESEPWGVVEQPAFANAVAVIDTGLRADDLLGVFKDIEAKMGRESAEPNGPRVIDLDILLFGDEEWDLPELTIPHPRMLEREFVVTPLLDVDPHVRMPDGSPVTAERAVRGRILGLVGVLPGFEERTWGEALPGAQSPLEADPAMEAERPPLREALPDEPWVPVWNRPGYNPVYSMPTPVADGLGAAGGGQVPGIVPNIEANFAQLVLAQLGIPHAWDPFAPEMSSDPYGLTRPFQLLVPESMAEEAKRAIDEAGTAPIDWGEMPG